MDELENPVSKGRSIVILVVVLLGIGGVGAGGYLAWSRQQGAGGAAAVAPAAGQDDLAKWCEMRKEWAKKIKPLASDLMLKSVRPEDKAEHDKLFAQRGLICQDYAKRVREFLKEKPSLFEKVKGIEEAFVKEGKIRANTSIEIANHLAKVGSDITGELRKELEGLTTRIPQRVKSAKEATDQELDAGLKAAGATCADLSRGTMIDEGTADSPYISWDELEVRRTMAVKQFESRLKELEPVEEFTNRVYHEMVSRYRQVLVDCYQKYKRLKPELSDQMGMRVRLKRSGEVKTLAIEWMDKRDDRVLDCILEKAAKWKLPQPDEKTGVVVVTIDFSKL
jgi:hypothetical protein